MAETIFWACAAFIVYTYVLYPALLFAIYSIVQVWRDLQYLSRQQNRRRRPAAQPPLVSVIIPAHNEIRHLPAKLRNLAALTYPRERLQVVFVSDQSTDGTDELLRASGWRTIRLPERKGKANALNRAVEQAEGEILVLCDASTLMPADAIENIARHFDDPRVGLVSTTVLFIGTAAETRRTETVYWRYENAIRLMEARLGITLVASGPLYALRRSCFRKFPLETLVDDLITPLWVRQARLKVGHDGEAVAIDNAAATGSEEFNRRIRLAVGTMRAFPEMIRTPSGVGVLLAFLSHKVFRWIFFLSMVGLAASNLMLTGVLYRSVLGMQIVFYLLAAAGYRWRRPFQSVRFLLLPYFLTAMHMAFLIGMIQWARGKWPGGTWKRVT